MGGDSRRGGDSAAGVPGRLPQRQRPLAAQLRGSCPDMLQGGPISFCRWSQKSGFLCAIPPFCNVGKVFAFWKTLYAPSGQRSQAIRAEVLVRLRAAGSPLLVYVVETTSCPRHPAFFPLRLKCSWTVGNSTSLFFSMKNVNTQKIRVCHTHT